MSWVSGIDDFNMPMRPSASATPSSTFGGNSTISDADASQQEHFFNDAYADFIFNDMDMLRKSATGGPVDHAREPLESSPEPSSGATGIRTARLANGRTVVLPTSLSRDAALRRAPNATTMTSLPSPTGAPGQSPMAGTAGSNGVGHSPIMPSSAYNVLPNPAVGSLIEDLTFPTTVGAPMGSTSAAMSGTPLESLAEEADIAGFGSNNASLGRGAGTGAGSSGQTKRARADGNPDALFACWTSPLCPNHSKEGTPPNPATCGGACAPYLFDPDAPSIPDSTTDFLANVSAPDSFSHTNTASLSSTHPGLTRTTTSGTADLPRPTVELINRQRLKRSESDSSSMPSGRTFSKHIDIKAELAGSETPEALDGTPDRSGTVVSGDGGGGGGGGGGGEAGGAGAADGPADAGEEGKGKTKRRLPHNQVERKYRESLNTQLEGLRRVVPALQPQHPGRACDGNDIEDLPAPSKPSKAVVLASATAYIKQLEKEKRQLLEEIQALRQRNRALQGLVKCDDCTIMQYFMNMKLQRQQM